jgi:hypothetical protein
MPGNASEAGHEMLMRVAASRTHANSSSFWRSGMRSFRCSMVRTLTCTALPCGWNFPRDEGDSRRPSPLRFSSYHYTSIINIFCLKFAGTSPIVTHTVRPVQREGGPVSHRRILKRVKAVPVTFSHRLRALLYSIIALSSSRCAKVRFLCASKTSVTDETPNSSPS